MRSEQIPYGVKDFKRIRLEDLYYVDKTAFIRKPGVETSIFAFRTSLFDQECSTAYIAHDA